MAEAFKPLYKAELVRNRGPWRGLDELELATVEHTGTTTGAYTASSDTSHPPSTKHYTR